MRRWMGVLCMSMASMAWSVDESNLEQAYAEKILPWLNEAGVPGSFTGADGLNLRYLKIEHPEERAAVVVLGGHTESYIKYAELFYDLRNEGLSFYALDLRNQGFSDRLLEDREKDHVRRYEDYVADVKIFVDSVVKQKPHPKIFFLARSLGGGVAAAYLQKHPGDIDAAILSAPLVAVKLGVFQRLGIRVLGLFTDGKDYVPDGGPFAPVSFEENRETHSRVRHERKFQDYVDHPEIKLGYPTVGWFVQMLRMTNAIQARARSIAVPLLVFQAETDDYTDRVGQDRFCAKVKQCRKVRLEGSFHEMLIEIDPIRDKVLAEIRAFIDTRSDDP